MSPKPIILYLLSTILGIGAGHTIIWLFIILPKYIKTFYVWPTFIVFILGGVLVLNLLSSLILQRFFKNLRSRDFYIASSLFALFGFLIERDHLYDQWQHFSTDPYNNFFQYLADWPSLHLKHFFCVWLTCMVATFIAQRFYNSRKKASTEITLDAD